MVVDAYQAMQNIALYAAYAVGLSVLFISVAWVFRAGFKSDERTAVAAAR